MTCRANNIRVRIGTIGLALIAMTQHAFGQVDALPTVQELHDKVRQVQDRYTGKVFEVDGVASNVLDNQRPLPFHVRMDDARIWHKYWSPAFVSAPDLKDLKGVGMSQVEVGAVGNILARVSDKETAPRYLVAAADREWRFSEQNQLSGLLIAFGKLRDLNRYLNQDKDSFLCALLLHPSAEVRATDSNQLWLVEATTDLFVFRVLLNMEPEIHCTQLEVLHKKSMESSIPTTIRYHSTEIGWIPKSCIRSWDNGRNLIVTYNEVRLRTEVPDHEFLPEFPEGVEISGKRNHLEKLRIIRSAVGHEVPGANK